MELSPKIKAKHAQKWANALAADLRTGETIWAFLGLGRFKPFTTAIAITNQRILGFNENGQSQEKRIPIQVAAHMIRGFDFPTKFNTTMRVMTDHGEVNFGILDAKEVDFARHYLTYLQQPMDKDATRPSTPVAPGAQMPPLTSPTSPVEQPIVSATALPENHVADAPTPTAARPAADVRGVSLHKAGKDAKATVSLASELEKLATMHRRGILDDDEFKAAKQAVISRLQ